MTAEIATRSTSLRRVLAVSSEALGDAPDAIALGVPAGSVNTSGFKGLQGVSFFGEGADNAVIDWRLLHVEVVSAEKWSGGKGDEAPMTIAREYAVGTATLGIAVGVEGGVVSDDERFADAIAVTSKSAFATHLETLYASELSVYAEADGVARMTVPDFGNGDLWLLQVGADTATNGNALVSLGT